MSYKIVWKNIHNNRKYIEYGDRNKVNYVLDFLEHFFDDYELVSITPEEE